MGLKPISPFSYSSFIPPSPNICMLSLLLSFHFSWSSNPFSLALILFPSFLNTLSPRCLSAFLKWAPPTSHSNPPTTSPCLASAKVSNCRSSLPETLVRKRMLTMKISSQTRVLCWSAFIGLCSLLLLESGGRGKSDPTIGRWWFGTATWRERERMVVNPFGFDRSLDFGTFPQWTEVTASLERPEKLC